VTGVQTCALPIYLLVPDAFLLMGFWPLLFASRTRWLWLLFGVLNIFIGFVLLVIRYLPNDDFRSDKRILATKLHLVEYHEPFAWMTVGVLSAATGLVLLTISLVSWLVRVKKKKTV